MASNLHLRAFRTVIETGSVTRSAERLGRAQPHVSRLISEYEDEVGFALFVRTARRVVPTERALRLYDEVAAALDRLEAVARTADELRREVAANLRILAPMHAAHSVIPDAVEIFQKMMPHARVSIDVVIRNAMGAIANYRPFDIGIAVLPFEAPGVRIENLGELPLVAVMAKDHPLRHMAAVTSEDLARYPFIAISRNTPLWSRVNEIMSARGIEPNICIETHSSISAASFAARGLGVTIVDALTARAVRRDSIYRPWKDNIGADVGLIFPIDAIISEECQLFAATLRKLVQKGTGRLRSTINSCPQKNPSTPPQLPPAIPPPDNAPPAARAR